MLNKCVGIVSYLPDEPKLRQIRQKKLISLLDQVNKLFDLPVIIVAQNWKDFSVSCCQLYNYAEALGIVGARNVLRKIFLSLGYDYMIMLDDDCTLIGTKEQADEYLAQIDEHPGMFGMFYGTLLKLFAISKEMFALLDFGKGKVENGDYFEDILFVETLKKKYPKKAFQFKHNGIKEKSDNAWDENSTWYHHQYNKHEMGDRTRLLLKEIK